MSVFLFVELSFTAGEDTKPEESCLVIAKLQFERIFPAQRGDLRVGIRWLVVGSARDVIPGSSIRCGIPSPFEPGKSSATPIDSDFEKPTPGPCQPVEKRMARLLSSRWIMKTVPGVVDGSGTPRPLESWCSTVCDIAILFEVFSSFVDDLRLSSKTFMGLFRFQGAVLCVVWLCLAY